MKNTKRSLWASGLTLLLCLVLFVGTTFAWFTDSVTSNGNKIQAGTLDITATVASIDKNANSTFTIKEVNGGEPFGFGEKKDIEEAQTSIISEELWEPGKSNAKLLTVTNKGDLAAKIKLQFEVTDAGLTGALWYDFVQVTNDNLSGSFTRRPMITLNNLASSMDDTVLEAGESLQFILVYGMNEDAGNEYQGKSFEANVTILGTQATVETDGFNNNQYDKEATYPVTTSD